MAQVKTYRVLRDGMRVGHSVRDFGDFMPEAREFPTLRSLLNSNVIEEVYVEQEQFDDWEKEQKKRDEARLSAIENGEDPDLVDEDDEDEGGSADDAPVKPKAKKTTKRAPKKSTAKKKTTKKVVAKKGKSNGKLEERSV